MRRTHLKIKFLVAALSMVCLMPASAWALDQPSFGGNNASDYQPTTGNPQSSTSTTSLQPNNTVLQPVTLLDQQALVQSGGLTVLTAPDHGATSTVAEPIGPQKSHAALFTWIIGGLLTFAAVAYIVFKPDKKPAPQTSKSPPAEKPTTSEKPKKTKKGAKKTSRKKRKAGRS